MMKKKILSNAAATAAARGPSAAGKRRLVSAMVTLCMMLCLLPASITVAHAETPNYLTFTAQEANSSVTLNYRSGSEMKISRDGVTWTDYTPGTVVSLPAVGDRVQFQGKNIVTSDGRHFTMTGKIAASGDVTSLTNGVGGDATLASACYPYMFTGCASLTVAPALPSTTLAVGCYYYMFKECTGLTQPPALPATTLAGDCYTAMFIRCSNLLTLPALPAEELPNGCYFEMFSGCASLKISETQTGDYTIPWRISSTSIADFHMFSGTGGPFKGTPKVNTTYYILSDKTAPVVSGVENGKTYCGPTAVSIADESGTTATLSGSAVTITDGRLTVPPKAGAQTLVITDQFGNETSVTFTVNSEHSWDDGCVTTQPTATSAGVKSYTCTVCGAPQTEAITPLPPTMTEGSGAAYTEGGEGGLRFTSNAAFSDFLAVAVDGAVIDDAHFDVAEGSIIVTLKSAYLNTLSAGRHTVEIHSMFGTAEAAFTVKKAGVPTGDAGAPALWMAVLAVSIAAAALCAVGSWKRKHGKG